MFFVNLLWVGLLLWVIRLFCSLTLKCHIFQLVNTFSYTVHTVNIIIILNQTIKKDWFPSTWFGWACLCCEPVFFCDEVWKSIYWDFKIFNKVDLLLYLPNDDCLCNCLSRKNPRLKIETSRQYNFALRFNFMFVIFVWD